MSAPDRNDPEPPPQATGPNPDDTPTAVELPSFLRVSTEGAIDSTTDAWGAPPDDPEIGLGSTTLGAPVLREPLIDRRFGHFVLLQVLGQGRQAVVWKAVHLGSSPGMVALKVFSPDWPLDKIAAVARLRMEAGRGGWLEGTAIMPIHEFGSLHGHAYYTMPLIDGPSLAGVIRQRQDALEREPPARPHPLVALPEPDYLRAVVRLVWRIARGLGALHDARVIHCDVKPSNILIDGLGNPFLCDFGLARILEPSPSQRTGPISGTPMYMAREKLLGLSVIDELRCDVYALGVTLFEALSLARPFAVPSRLSRSKWAGFMADLLTAPPPALGHCVPAGLRATILKAMDPDPACRHASAAEFADELEGFEFS